MQNNLYIKIGPQNITNKIFPVIYSAGTFSQVVPGDICCATGDTINEYVQTGITYVYSSMTQILSGGTNGSSILTGLTVPILITENAIDPGYYSTFDGNILQKDTMINFLFVPGSSSPQQDVQLTTINLYNTSETNLKNYLQFSTYKIDWGDGTPIENVNSSSPFYYSHTYAATGQYTITMSGQSPWGINLIQKKVNIPITPLLNENPYGEAFFIPQGGSWSGTPISYNYIFTGDSNTNIEDFYSSNYTTLPIIVTGYTKSSLNDLTAYGNKENLIGGKFKLGIVSGSTGVGEFIGVGPNNLYTAYTLNDITYYDYFDGTTIFIVDSSGFTSDWLVMSALTKNEALINVIDEPEVQSNVFIERGKNSAVENIVRLGEVDNIDELVNYGYKFFKINTSNQV